MINPSNITGSTTPVPTQIQDQEVAPPQVPTLFDLVISQQTQAGYKRFHPEDNSTEEGEHLSKRVKKEAVPETSSVSKQRDNAVINFCVPGISLNIHFPPYLMTQGNAIRAEQWDLALQALMEFPSRRITHFNNDLIKFDKWGEFIEFLKSNVIPEKTRDQFLAFTFENVEFWKDWDEEIVKQEYFQKIFEIEEAFQGNFLAKSLKKFIGILSPLGINLLMNILEERKEVKKGFQFNYHHILSTLFFYEKEWQEYEIIFEMCPEVDLFKLTEKIVNSRRRFRGSELSEKTLVSYAEVIFKVVVKHAQKQKNFKFFNRFGMEAFQIFPNLYNTSAVIKILSTFCLKDLQNQILLQTAPLNLLTHMQTSKCDKTAKKIGVNCNQLQDRLHFINMPSEEPSHFKLEFYQQFLKYAESQSNKVVDKSCLSIKAMIALKESQIKMTKAFESVFYAFDAHRNETWFYLPEELKQQIALYALRSERPLSSIPKKMLLEKRIQWINSIPPRLRPEHRKSEEFFEI